MQVTVELKGPFGRIFGENRKQILLQEDLSVGGLRCRLKSMAGLEYDNLIATGFIFRNGIKLADQERLAEGDTLALLMAIFSGG